MNVKFFIFLNTRTQIRFA